MTGAWAEINPLPLRPSRSVESLWIFELSYSSPKYALIGLSNITGADVEETSDYGVFVSYTPKQLTITKGLDND